MAKDDDKTVVEGTGKPEESGSEDIKKAGKKNLIMLGGIGLGAIVIGLVLALFVIKPMMSSDSTAEEPAEEVQQKEDSHAEKKEKEKPKKETKKSGHGKEQPGGGIYVYTVSDIVVNPAGTGGSRFLSVSFGFEVESEHMLSVFGQKEPIVRDALITILSSKTVAHLTDPKQKEIIRLLIKKKVSQIMETDELAGVYYTDFVLQ